jgi:hypothetical protein
MIIILYNTDGVHAHCAAGQDYGFHSERHPNGHEIIIVGYKSGIPLTARVPTHPASEKPGAG